MNSYLILKVLDDKSISISSTIYYGDVELRSYRSDSDYEIEQIKVSAENNNMNYDNFLYCARIATVVECGSIDDALKVADDRFSTVLDLKSTEFVISSLTTSPIGYARNMNNGEISPLCRTGFSHSLSFAVQERSIQQFDVINYILSLNTDLSNRYLRSLHWFRNWKHENNKQIKILFYWFAMEALLKENDSDNICGINSWFLGFPSGKSAKYVRLSILRELELNPRYKFWKKELIKIFDEIRIFRNDSVHSVHSGFRSQDFDFDKIYLYEKVMIYCVSRAHASVKNSIISGVDNVKDFKEYIFVNFEENNNLLNDVNNNIIYSLDEIRENIYMI